LIPEAFENKGLLNTTAELVAKPLNVEATQRHCNLTPSNAYKSQPLWPMGYINIREYCMNDHDRGFQYTIYSVFDVVLQYTVCLMLYTIHSVFNVVLQ
jgi:hypothetical protein